MSTCVCTHLERRALQTLYGQPEVAQQEGPGVDEVDAVHGHHHDAVPALEAPGQAVLDEERVREHKPMLLIPEEDWALAARTHLQEESQQPDIKREEKHVDWGIINGRFWLTYLWKAYTM